MWGWWGVGVLLLVCWFCGVGLLFFHRRVEGVAHGERRGKKRNKSAQNTQKCAISYVMLLNFLAYMYFCGARACIFLKRPYLCIVFFIVLDLRLTRLGYSGIPFFFVPMPRCPRCLRLERHMCHSVNLFAPKGFLLCRCWWGALLVSFFSFLLFFLLIFPTRDASPPLELAFRGSVWC